MAGKSVTANEVTALLRNADYDELPEVIERYKDDQRKAVTAALKAALNRYEHEKSERLRVSNMYSFQAEIAGTGIVVGVDEVGRGSIAGPLTVAAVALPAEPIIWGLNDSKKLSPKKRELLAAKIKLHATAIGIAHIEPASIDAVGMGVCIKMAMKKAVENAGVEFDGLLIDGNPVHIDPREKTLVQGDSKVPSIAAASIIAKVTRDAMMVEYDQDYPGYGFAQSKGYGSADHIKAIQSLGLSDIHRVSFCGNFMPTEKLF